MAPSRHMIVALTGMDGNGAVADLAEDLAMLRVAAGSRVLLVCPDPGNYDARLYDDLVIDASREVAGVAGAVTVGANASADAALERAAVIVALVRPAELELELEQEKEQKHGGLALLERLRQAQRRNPAARVLVTVAHGSEPLTPHQAGCLLVFVARIPGARLADMLEVDQHGACRSHCSALELDARKTAYVLCAPEVRHLYSEVFRGGAAGGRV